MTETASRLGDLEVLVAEILTAAQARRLAIAQVALLPSVSAVYLVFRGQEVIYVGRTGDLRQRWRDHHRWPQVQDCEIGWIEMPVELTAAWEQTLITTLRPALNGTEQVDNSGRPIHINRILWRQRDYWLKIVELRHRCARDRDELRHVLSEYAARYKWRNAADFVD